jgi:acylphosphatase
MMQRLTVHISGKVPEPRYKGRAIGLARIYKLNGYAKNLEDGRMIVVAEGDCADLKRFSSDLNISKERDAVDIQNVYSPATGEFEFFLDNDKPDRFYEMMTEASRGIKELRAMLGEMKADRLQSHK